MQNSRMWHVGSDHNQLCISGDYVSNFRGICTPASLVIAQSEILGADKLLAFVI